MSGLSIIVPSVGRDSLAVLLAILTGQMRPGDELLVDVNDDCPFGNAARNRLMGEARLGNGLVFFDDDDLVLEGALDSMRSAYIAAPDRLHIFKMDDGKGRVIWSYQHVACGNVSTQMICVPRSWALCSRWGERYEGDFDFISGLAQRFGADSIIWHSNIVATRNGLTSS